MSKLSQAIRQYENMSEPPVAQANTSIAKMTLYGLPAALVGYFAFLVAANAFLPAGDADRVKAMLDVVFSIVAATLGGGGTLALMGRSLMLTNGKIKSQTPAQPDTVNVGSAENVNTGESTPLSFAAPEPEYSEPEFVEFDNEPGALQDEPPPAEVREVVN